MNTISAESLKKIIGNIFEKISKKGKKKPSAKFYIRIIDFDLKKTFRRVPN